MRWPDAVFPRRIRPIADNSSTLPRHVSDVSGKMNASITFTLSTTRPASSAMLIRPRKTKRVIGEHGANFSSPQNSGLMVRMRAMDSSCSYIPDLGRPPISSGRTVVAACRRYCSTTSDGVIHISRCVNGGSCSCQLRQAVSDRDTFTLPFLPRSRKPPRRTSRRPRVHRPQSSRQAAPVALA